MAVAVCRRTSPRPLGPAAPVCPRTSLRLLVPSREAHHGVSAEPDATSRHRLGDRPRRYQEKPIMKARKTSVVVLSALLALGSTVVGSVPAQAGGRSSFH